MTTICSNEEVQVVSRRSLNLDGVSELNSPELTDGQWVALRVQLLCAIVMGETEPEAEDSADPSPSPCGPLNDVPDNIFLLMLHHDAGKGSLAICRTKYF